MVMMRIRVTMMMMMATMIGVAALLVAAPAPYEICRQASRQRSSAVESSAPSQRPCCNALPCLPRLF